MMKTQDVLVFTIWSAIPLAIILMVFLSGCSRFEVKESEKIAEEVLQDVIAEDSKG